MGRFDAHILGSPSRGWTVALVMGLAVSGAVRSEAQPVALADARLARITADASSTSDPPTVGGYRIGSVAEGQQPELSATGVYVSNTRVASSHHDEVRLTGDAQSQIVAGGITNAAGADVANATNLFDGSLSEEPDKYRIEIEQQNRVEQTAKLTGSLGEFATLGPSRESSFDNQHSTWSTFTSGRSREHRDRHVQLTSVTRTIDAVVIPDSIGLFDEPISLGTQVIQLPGFQLGFDSFDVELVLVDLPGELFDIKGSFKILGPSFIVRGATLTTGSVVIDGPDVILMRPRLTLPRLEFGFCFLSGGCTGDNSNQGVTLAIPSITIPIGLGDLVLSDVNPLSELGIDYGYAVLGDGRVTVSSGGVEVRGAIPIDLDALVGLFSNVRIPLSALSGGLVNDLIIPIPIPPLNLPTFEIPVDFALDFPLPEGFDREFGGDDCHLVSSASGHCSASVIYTVEETHDGYESVTAYQFDTFEESHLSISTDRELGEVIVEGAEARVSVLRNSALESESYRVVVVRENSQKGLRALHAVNAAGAIVGNGVNVIRLSGSVESGAALPNSNVMQLNTFVQIGGL